MFPSCTGDNSFPQFQPSFHSTSFPGLNGNNNALNHHHDLLVHHVPVTASASNTVNSWAALTKPILTNQDKYRLNEDHCAALGILPKTRPVKKDRHSKIVTAQGPRDRRVRLSIDIAQKFFGLQDMLGFDKASKTLDWLLTKSKTSIEELVQMKHSGNALANVQSSGSECEVAMGIEAAENGDSEGDSLVNLTKLETAKQPQNAARESRANARARARERTRKKMCTLVDKHPGTRAGESLALSQLVASERSGSHICHVSTIKADTERDESIYHHLLTNAIAAKGITQEPVSLKRQITPPSMFGFQPNLIISNDTSSKDNLLPYTTGNWDTASRVTRSSMYAMTNISSSKVLQICGKPWEV